MTVQSVFTTMNSSQRSAFNSVTPSAAATVLETNADARVTIENPEKTEVIDGPWGSNPQIASTLATANRRRYRRPYNILFSIIILSLVVGIILIIVAGQQDEAGMLLGGGFLAALAFVLAISFSCLYCMRRPDSLDKEQHYTIRIEGDQWDRYLTYFFQADHKPVTYYSCIAMSKKRIDELRQRGYGHVIIGSSGMMIDEIYFISYGAIYVLGAELLRTTDENGVEDSMIRVQMTNRLQNESRASGQIFHVDVFVPPHMPADERTNIVDFLSVRRGHITVFVQR